MRNLQVKMVVILAGLLGSVAIAAQSGAVPRTADGRPDLNGTWDNGGGIEFLRPQKLADGSVCIGDCPATAAPAAPAAAASSAATPAVRLPPDRPKYRPELVAKVKELDAKQVHHDPVLRCQPPGVPRIGPPDKIVQTAREIVFLYEDVSGPFFRIVPLRSGVKRIDPSESYLGDAEGRWEGDTLVVETRNLNNLTWLTDDGSFHSPKLWVEERLTREAGRIVWQATAHDPDVLAEPWQVRPRVMMPAEFEMSEPAPCVEQDLSQMVDETHHDNAR